MMQRKHSSEAMTGAPGALPGEAIRILTLIVAPDWRNARMALRWTGTAMLEAKKTFRSLKAYKHLPVLRAALLRHQQAVLADQAIDRQSRAA